MKETPWQLCQWLINRFHRGEPPSGAAADKECEVGRNVSISRQAPQCGLAHFFEMEHSNMIGEGAL
jgi:hypothetical protein